MKKEDENFRQGHRERLRQKFLDDKLADYEMLELMLGYVIPRRDIRPLAHKLLKDFGSIHQIFSAPIKSLLKCPGIGRNTAIFIKVIYQMMISDYQYHLDKKPIFHNDKVLFNYCKLLLSSKPIEEFHVLYLDTQWRLISDDLHTKGTVDSAYIYPREILKRALELNARYVVMLHNHPTPFTSFSTEDIEVTTKVKTLLEMVGMNLYDHYVVSGGLIYSAREMFLLK